MCNFVHTGVLLQNKIENVSGNFEDFVEADGFGTFTWRDGTIYLGPFLKGRFDTTGEEYFCR